MLKNKILIIVLLSLFIFRLALILQNLMWFQDTANDQFFAVKIVNDLRAGNLIIQEGITNSGLDIRYPPFYTFLLAFIRLVSNTYEATLVVHIFLSSFLLILIYKIAKLLSSEKGGLVALLIALVSPVLIEESAVVYSAYFPLPFAFLALYLLLKELLNKKPNTAKILISLFLLAFMTTFSYALNFQIVLSVTLILFFIKDRFYKFLFSFAAGFFFLIFNLKALREYSIYEFLKSNFNSLFFPGNEVYRPGLYENLLQQFYNKPEIVVVGLAIIFVLLIYFIKSKSSGASKKAVLILLFYWMISSAVISRFGQFYKGIFAYPIIYVVLGCFLDKMAEGYYPKNHARLVVGTLTVLVFIILPADVLPILRPMNASHYHLSKEYAQKVVGGENSKTLFLVLTERNNRLVYWTSLNIWYYDYLINNKNYELLPSQFCPALLEGECFRITPDKIKIICTIRPPEIYIFDIVKKRDCDNEAERINTLVGVGKFKVDGSFYEIEVDKKRYNSLTTSLLY